VNSLNQGRATPRVVLFRQSGIDADTRAKKFALTLARLGYEPILLAPVAPGDPLTERRLGPVRVIPVEIGTAHFDANREALWEKRSRRIPVLSRLSKDDYLERLGGRRKLVREALARTERRDAAFLAHRTLLEFRKAQVVLLQKRQSGQMAIDRTTREAWRAWTKASRSTALFATVEGMLPEVLDLDDAYRPVLEQLAPDVIHAHHPFVLPTAVRAAAGLRTAGHQVRLVYDARENFKGIPQSEWGTKRRHHVLVELEADTIEEFDAVITVSDPIADVLQDRYELAARPSVVLNMPPRTPLRENSSHVRNVAGVADGVPLLVYSGGVSRARGIDSLIDAMALLPEMHLALVTVPYPHPRIPDLMDRADQLGVAHRVHVLPPVGQDELISFLAGADVGVHPMLSGSPNHDMAVPNKLFEYLHAGVTLAVSDARTMAAFVRSHHIGTVFRSNDPEDLARAVRGALAMRAGQSLGEREKLAGEYCWQAQEPVIARTYARLAPVVERPRAEDFPSLDITDVAAAAEGGQ